MKSIKNNIIFIIFTLLSLLMICFLVIKISILNIVPLKYIIILIVILFILNLIAILLHIPKNKIIRSFSYIIYILIIVSSIIGITYINKTIIFLKESFNDIKMTSVNKYILLTNKEYDDIYSFRDKQVGYYKIIPNINKAIDKLNTAVNNNYKDYIDINTLFKDLDNSIIDGVLIEESIYNSMKENVDSISFDNYKILYNYEVIVDLDTTSDKINNTFTIYINGVDFTYQNADFNMLVTVNRSTRKVLLTSIPRDYYIYLPTMDTYDSLEFISVWGIDVPISGLEKLFDIDIDYYIKVNTKSLVNLVDTLGGIEFCSDKSFWTTHAQIMDSYDDFMGRKLYVSEGCKVYSGIQILTIARERKFNGGDRVRQENCKNIMLSIAKKMGSFDSLTNYTNVLNSLKDLYETNIPDKLITSIIKEYLDGGKWDVESTSLDGENDYGLVHLGTVSSYIMTPNKDSVDASSKKIKEMYN